jgi:hypothetical protein
MNKDNCVEFKTGIVFGILVYVAITYALLRWKADNAWAIVKWGFLGVGTFLFLKSLFVAGQGGEWTGWKILYKHCPEK